MSLSEKSMKEKIAELQAAVQRLTASVEDNTFEACACCGNMIRYGNAVVEIERTVQQMDRNSDGVGLSVNVIDSAVLAYICYSCGNENFTPRRLRRQLAELLELPPSQPVVDDAVFDIKQTPDPCDRCGCQIQPGNAEVELGIMIAQVDWSEKYDDSLITPIYAESLFTFCAPCGNKMSEDCLQEALAKVLVRKGTEADDDYDWDNEVNDNGEDEEDETCQ